MAFPLPHSPNVEILRLVSICPLVRMEYTPTPLAGVLELRALPLHPQVRALLSCSEHCCPGGWAQLVTWDFAAGGNSIPKLSEGRASGVCI